MSFLWHHPPFDSSQIGGFAYVKLQTQNGWYNPVWTESGFSEKKKADLKTNESGAFSEQKYADFNDLEISGFFRFRPHPVVNNRKTARCTYPLCAEERRCNTGLLTCDRGWLPTVISGLLTGLRLQWLTFVHGNSSRFRHDLSLTAPFVSANCLLPRPILPRFGTLRNRHVLRYIELFNFGYSVITTLIVGAEINPCRRNDKIHAKSVRYVHS